MVRIEVQFKGLPELRMNLHKFGTRSPRIMDRIVSEFADEVIKSMKGRMANNYFTGQMLETLRKEGSRGNYTILDEAPYLIYQETGFRRHFVPGKMQTGGGRTFEDWIREKFMPRHPEMKRQPAGLFVSKPMAESHIILPSIASATMIFPQIAERILEEELR